MATVTAPPPPRVPQYGPSVFVRTLLPLALLLALLAGVGAAVVYAVFWWKPSLGADKTLVWRRVEEPIALPAPASPLQVFLGVGVLLGALLLAAGFLGLWLWLRKRANHWSAPAAWGALLGGFVGLLALIYLFTYWLLPGRLGGREISGYWWLALIGPVLMLGLVYVAWMYFRDGATIGWAWASFLGALRCTTYALLALVFLLPSVQEYEEQRADSRVALVFDISGSMLFIRDDVAAPGQPLNQLPTRQDKVLAFLNDNRVNFMKRLQEQNPVVAYRMGRSLDEDFRVFDRAGQVWTAAEWEKYARAPDKKPKTDQEAESAAARQKREKEHNALVVTIALAGLLFVLLVWLGSTAFAYTQNRVGGVWVWTAGGVTLAAAVAALLIYTVWLPRATAVDVPDSEAQAPIAEDAPRPTPWGPEQWVAWLKPDLDPPVPENLTDKQREEFFKQVENLRRLTGATNIGTPLRKVYDREKNNLLQGLIVITDGRTTEGSTDALRALIEDARKADPQVPVFVVAVGEDRERVRLEITDVRVPEQIRPEDRFRAAVDLTGEGLVDKEVLVELDIFRVDRKTDKPEGEIVLVEMKGKEPTGAEVALGPRVTLKAPAKFLPGNPPHAQVEWAIDAATLAKAVGKEPPEGIRLEFKDDADGQLRFQARVARDVREDFAEKEHKSDPADMQVVKRPLRVLLVASGPMRDYQFVRTLLVRETDKNRAELSVYLQPAPGQETPREGRVQDVPKERLLTEFPTELRDEKLDKGEERFRNLASYDVIIAFDPDWNRLSERQIHNLEQWVGTHGGGLIVVGGPINTLQLARPGAGKDKLRAVINLYPVHLADSRVQEVNRPTDKPWRLRFPGATPNMEFLKLDEEDPKAPALRGWDNFFTAVRAGEKADGPADKQPTRRGFYNFYPVKGKKDAAITIATFTDDSAKLEDGSEHPYMVEMPYGSGKTFWIGSAETWRLRQFKEAYHERFWTKLTRYLAAGAAERSDRRLRPNMGRTFTARNPIPVELQAFGADMKPLPQKFKPRVTIKPPESARDVEKEQTFDLEPKPTGSSGDWNGWFAGRFVVNTPGVYNIEYKIPETGDTATGKFTVKESNPELDNPRPDFAALYDLASDAERVLKRVPEEVARELRERLQRRKADPKAAKTDSGMKKDSAPDERLKLYFDLNTASLIPNCMKYETRTQRNRGAANDLWDSGYVLWNRDPPDAPITMSWVLTIVAGLLSLEWLSRKLLRLA
jgi:hypothetical protein